MPPGFPDAGSGTTARRDCLAQIVRATLFVAAIIAAALLASPAELRSALATAASALFEATPFILTGVALERILRRPVVAYLSCGCGTGPSARSLPAAAATCLAFGPAVALARFLAAVAVARCLGVGACGRDEAPRYATGPLDELASLVPAALTAAVVTQATAALDISALKPFAQLAGGAFLAFATAPCALGAVAIAGSLHARAPLAATAFLCVAGIVDLRAIGRRHRAHAPPHDALAYATLTLALGIVGCRHGGGLVHPTIARALLGAGVVTLGLFAMHRSHENAHVRYAPALMLAGALAAAPPPQYHATETTLSDLFAGERLTFTGTLARNGGRAALVRYAIACCRVDAAAVVVRLARAPAYPAGTWLRASGEVALDAGEPLLVLRAIERVAPPADPFIYR
jgi:hypothetical protein